MATGRKRAPAIKPKKRSAARPLRSSLSSDWYWEQDAALRFVRIDVQTGTPGERELAAKSLGRRPWETGVCVEGGWDAHRALLRTRAPFREVLMWRDLDDGSRRYISVSGEPVFDAGKRFAGYRGVGRDITRQKRGELLLRLQYTVTRSLAEAAEPVDGTQAALRAICETEGWDLGQFWRLDPGAGVMRRFAHWVMPGAADARRFADASRDVEFAEGAGLVGAAWRAGEAIWVADSTRDPRARRKALAEETGLRAALLCPIRSDGRVVGVLGFDCARIRPPDAALLEALGAVTVQLGQFLKRASAEQRLRERERLLAAIVDHAPECVKLLDSDGSLLEINPAGLRMIEAHTLDEVRGMCMFELVTAEHRAAFSELTRRAAHGEAGSLHFAMLGLKGARRWLETQAVPMPDDPAGRRLVLGITRDVTEQKAAEAALRESEERFRRTFELAGSGVAHLSLERRFLRVNRKLCEILGYPEIELIGRPVMELSHPEDVAMTSAERERLYRGHIDSIRLEKRYLRKDGSVVWAALSLALERDAEGRPLYEIAVYDDITAQKRGEQLLRLEHTLALLFSESADSPAAIKGAIRAICESEHWECGRYLQVDEPAAVLRCEEAWSVPSADIEGYVESSRAMVYGRGVGLVGIVWESGEPLWVADIRHDSRVARKALARDTGMRGAFAFPVLLKGRTIGVFIFQSRELRQPDSRLLQAMHLIGSQIGQFVQRAQAERAMRDSEGRFRSLTELSSDWFWELDADYRFTRLEGRNVAGGDRALRERLIGTRRWDSGLEVEGGWDAHRALLDAHSPFRDVLMWRRMSDGSQRYVAVSGEPMFAPDGRFAGYRGVGRDVTLEKRAEQLMRLEHQVARALSEADDSAGGLRAVMRAVCRSEGWTRGRYFAPEGAADTLVFEHGWPADDAADRKDDAGYRRGEGLVGLAWQGGEPVWSSEGFAFPVRSEGSVIGVIAFSSRAPREPDERLRQAAEVIGAEVGQFLRRIRAEEDMRRFRLSMDSSADMILLIDVPTMRFVDVNTTACGLLGYSRQELLALGPHDVLPASRQDLEAAYQALIASPDTVGSMHSHYVCKDGSHLPFESTRRVLRSAGRPLIVAISRDIRERIAAEEALRESEARFRALTEMSSDFYWETDAQHRLTDMTYGRGASGKLDEALGRAAWEIPSTHPDEAGWAELRAKVDAHEAFRDFEFGRPRDDGSVRYFSVSGEPRFAGDGAFLGYRGVGRDITDVVLARERIASLAYHDALTGLANRTSLAPALEQAVERTRRRGSKLAGVFLDLDGFKQINDLHGHDAGDRLLAEAAQRLRAALRSGDPVARLGGDEFFVVLEDLQSNAPAERVAKKLLAALEQPYDLGSGRQAQISASIGISVFPDDAGDAATLMKHADSAMYSAKQAGKNAYRFFRAGAAANDGRTAGEEQTL